MKQNISSNSIYLKTDLEPISENLLKHAATVILGKEKNTTFKSIYIEKLLPYEKRFNPIESYDRMSMLDTKSFNKIVSYLKSNNYFLIIDILPFHEIYCICRDFDENCYFLVDPFTKTFYSDLTDNFFNTFICHFKQHFETSDKSIDVTTLPLTEFYIEPSFVATLFKFNFFFREDTKEIHQNINKCLSFGLQPIQSTPNQLIPIQSTPNQLIPIQATPNQPTPIQETPNQPDKQSLIGLINKEFDREKTLVKEPIDLFKTKEIKIEKDDNDKIQLLKDSEMIKPNSNQPIQPMKTIEIPIDMQKELSKIVIKQEPIDKKRKGTNIKMNKQKKKQKV
jgi:hypothetical protein